jgi:galactosyl transferase GMA12/MNN10 family
MPDEGLDSLLRLLEGEPENPWSAPSRFGAPGRLARALLRRLLRPYEVRQRETQRELVRALMAMRERFEREHEKLREIAVPGAERLVVLEARSRGSREEGPSSRRVLCSLGIGPYLDVLAVSSVTFEAYAALHGYDLVLSTEPIAPERPPAWQKIALARRLLDSYDEVLWVDADAIFLDISQDVADLVQPGKDLYLVEHVWEGGRARSANTGVFLVRATDWSRNFLDRVWAAEQWIDHPWWENAAVLDLLGYAVPPDLRPPYKVRTSDLEERVELLPAEWNSTEGEAAVAAPRIRHRGRRGSTAALRDELVEDLLEFRRGLVADQVARGRNATT